MCSQVQHKVPPQVHIFIESFCALLYTNKSTTMYMLKCNSIVTSSAALILTSNTPSVAFLYRSPRYTFRCSFRWTLSGILNGADKCTIKCTIKCNVKCVFFVTYLRIFNGSLNRTLRCTFKWKLKFARKYNF